MREPPESFAGKRRIRFRPGRALLVGLLPYLAAAALAATPPAPAADTPRAERYAGRPLADVLRSLQEQGLDVVFTSELVRPGMEVAEEPAARAPRQVLDEVLAPHGLAVREGPGGILVVVTASEAAAEAAAGETVLRRPWLHDEIVVRPSRLSLLFEQPDSPVALSRDEIESLPHLGGDVFRAISLLPGTAANDVTAQFSVHGGRRDEVRVLLDGQELYDAYHLHDYDNALSIVSARSLAGASLLTGAFPASQGDRMSGVLELRTIDPPAGRHYAAGASVLDALASTSGRFAGERGAYLLTARRGSLDLAGRVIGDEHPTFWDVLAKTELDTGLGRFAGHLLIAGDDLGLRREEKGGFERLANDYRRSYGWVTHQATPSERLLVETVASWADVRRNRAGATSEEKGSFSLRDRRDLEVRSLSQAWTLELAPRHQARWGFEARRYDASFDYAKDLEPKIVIAAPFSPPRVTTHAFDDTVTGDHLGLWASDRRTLFERLTVELGLRYDRHTATDDTLLSPRVNLAWRLGERSLVRASWGRFFQSQRPYELQVEDAETALFPAELSEHWVLGFEAVPRPNPLGVEAVRVELYRREIDDPRPRYENLLEPLNFFPEIEPDRVRIAPERSTADGVELLLRGGAGERFAWWLAYAYARAEDRIDGASVPRGLDQPHTVTLDLDFRLPRGWTLNLAWRYHSGWPTTPVELQEASEAEPTAAFGPLYGDRLPAYHRLDLRASRRFDLRVGRLTLYVDAQNLYDHKNLVGFDVVTDDQGAVVLDEELGPGIFPSFGVTWELGG